MSVHNVSREPMCGGDVYVGRLGHLGGGVWPYGWGNPFRLRNGESRGSTIMRYRKWLWAKMVAGEIPLDRLAELEGKRLFCHCAPQPCHAQVLTSAATWARQVLDSRVELR